MLRHDRQIRGRCVRKFSAGCKREDPSNSESLTTLISILSDNFPILHSGIATCDRAFAEISVARPAVTGIRYTRCLHLQYIPPHFPLPGNSWFQIPDLTVTTWLRFLITLDCAPPTPSCPRGKRFMKFDGIQQGRLSSRHTTRNYKKRLFEHRLVCFNRVGLSALVLLANIIRIGRYLSVCHHIGCCLA